MKDITILRGIPGAGKSTWIDKQLVKGKTEYLERDDGSEMPVSTIPERGAVFSADLWFEIGRPGYTIDGEKYTRQNLNSAHGWCLQNYAMFLAGDPTTCVVVDNTNISKHEIAPYYALAEAFNREVEIVTILCAPVVGAERNIHGADLNVTHRMHLLMEQEMMSFPSWWNHRVIA